MRFSLSSLARLALGLVLVSAAAAIGLARLAPAPTGWRMPGPVPYANINAFYLDSCKRGSFWLDRDGGPNVDVPTSGDELIEYAAVSPWRDERGRRQLIGRWSWSFRADGPNASFGLSRQSFPDGEVLDHVETDVVPVSVPCWYPGTRARVLFAAGDGKLYQYAFEPAGPRESASDRLAERPRPLAWRCKIPVDGDTYVMDPFWPSDPRFRDLILVALRSTEVGNRPRRIAGPTQIWWLRLSEDGDSIVEAGRLLEASHLGPEFAERCPTLAESRDGRLTMAYFRRLPPAATGLHLAELEFDPERRRPGLVAAPDTKLAEHCLMCPPVFSSDGRAVTVIRSAHGKREVLRIPLGDNPSHRPPSERGRVAVGESRSSR